MRGMDSGSHYTGIIFLKKQVEYDGKIVPWNMRHILQKCFIGSRVYKAAGGPGFHGAVIGKPGRMNGGQSLIGAVQFQKLLSDFLQRAAFQILMVAVIEINSRSYRIFVFGNAQTSRIRPLFLVILCRLSSYSFPRACSMPVLILLRNTSYTKCIPP